MGIIAGVGVLLPFPFYYWLWTNPQAWVNLCGRRRDPSKVMAMVSHFLKLLQLLSLFSVSSLSWPPPLYFWPLFLFGQFLNFRVYQLLGEAGTYYGVRFGENIPWVMEFPFGYIKDPQYIGSIMSLLACLSWSDAVNRAPTIVKSSNSSADYEVKKIKRACRKRVVESYSGTGEKKTFYLGMFFFFWIALTAKVMLFRRCMERATVASSWCGYKDNAAPALFLLASTNRLSFIEIETFSYGSGVLGRCTSKLPLQPII